MIIPIMLPRVGQGSPLRYFGVIFAGLLDWLCWGQTLDLSSGLGFLFITLEVIWILPHKGRE